ncbi:MAG: DUF4349 domain-containing protein [bacterium]|nr:DUF4349 domain-containing protein [bacterium]
MKCREAGDHLSAYLDNQLDAGLRGRLEEHLAGCPGCRRELEELRCTVELCRDLEEVAPPAGFHQAVSRAVRGAARVPRTPWRQLGRWWGGLPYRGVAVAAAVLVLVFALNLGWEGARLGFMGAPAPDEGMVLGKGGDVNFSRGGGDMAPAPAAAEMSEGWAGGTPSDPMPVYSDRKIIQNADLELAVEEFDRAFRDIVFLVEAAGGYVEGSSFWTGDGDRKGGHLRLRVPQESFLRVLAQIEDKGRLLHKSIYGQDVTLSYVDTEARLGALKLQEEQLLTILGRAQTVGEVLQVQDQLGRVRSQIESLIATLRNLDRLVSFSTIGVNLVPPSEEPPPPPEDLWSRIVQAFLNSLRTIARLGEQLIVLAVGLAPVAGLLAIVYLGWRLYRRRGPG